MNNKIKIDFSTIIYDEKNAKKILKSLSKKRKIADLFHRKITVEEINKKNENIHKLKNQYEYDIYVAVNTIQIDDKVQRYNYLYDEICYYLDHVCVPDNICEFKNNKCLAKRKTDVLMGCCHHYSDKKFGMLYQKNMVPCEYLGEKGCTTSAIGCKMFMCDEINKKGYKYTVYNVLLIRYFFNFIQKIIIKTGIFDSKENILNRIEKCIF